MNIFLNFVLFQLVWALSLYGVVIGYAWLGPLSLVGFVIIHAATSRTAKADFAVAVIAVPIGLTLDTLYIRSGLIAYNGELLWSGAAPLWILALWANFALTLNGCLGWLRERLKLAAVLGFVGGPLSYYGGIAVGTATVSGDSALLFGIIGVAWAIVVPFLLWLALQFAERWHPLPTPVISPA